MLALSGRPEHVPQGNPCRICGLPAVDHRVDHQFVGVTPEACAQCGLPLKNHRNRVRTRLDTRSRAGRARPTFKRKQESLYLGIDGEGQGRLVHRYVLLGSSDESGLRRWYVSDPDGLKTEACLEFIVSLPSYAKTFAYAFNYDLTKILQDLDNEALYLLFRPELRQRIGKDAWKGPRPVGWRDWSLNLQGTKFTVEHLPTQRRRIIWDIWKFYQSKFVGALTDWKIGTAEARAHMQLMKDKRDEFDKESFESVLEYMMTECRYMAELARKLVDAHEKAGLKLKSFYGAGSSASAMLTKMNVREKIMAPPSESRNAIAAGFFGGRFENSRIGGVDEAVYSWDISSAYPYQLYQLPCLLHGVWEHTTSRADIDTAQAALVRYRVSAGAKNTVNLGFSASTKSISWAPFPFRDSDGSICYPHTSPGGWIWKAEYLQGERMFPVEFREAWIYRTDCDCRPFGDIPKYYLERLKIGKEGPGIVLKLACNSCYGKVAQSVGRGPFNSWVWAGMITAGCRAQILQALAAHKDPANLLMVATDGIHTLEDIALPPPVDTGTDVEVIDSSTGKATRKPLGGWELKIYEKGVFYARPGVYFPMNPTAEDVKTVRGRGVGRGVVLENWKRIVDTWNRWDGFGEWPEAKVANVSRFCGAKTSISRATAPDGAWIYNRSAGDHTHPSEPEPRYGEWVKRSVRLSFNPWPKRLGLEADGVHLKVRAIDSSNESMPYKKAVKSEEAEELARAALELSEQPDVDLSDYS